MNNHNTAGLGGLDESRKRVFTAIEEMLSQETPEIIILDTSTLLGSVGINFDDVKKIKSGFPNHTAGLIRDRQLGFLPEKSATNPIREGHVFGLNPRLIAFAAKERRELKRTMEHLAEGSMSFSDVFTIAHQAIILPSAYSNGGVTYDVAIEKLAMEGTITINGIRYDFNPSEFAVGLLFGFPDSDEPVTQSYHLSTESGSIASRSYGPHTVELPNKNGSVYSVPSSSIIYELLCNLQKQNMSP